MTDNIRSDPSAPRLGIAQLVSVREYFDEPQLFVCVPCRYSEKAHMQIRCPMCLELMEVWK